MLTLLSTLLPMLRMHWKPLLLGLLVLLALGQGQYAYRAWYRHRLGKQADAVLAQRATQATTDAAAQRRADSLLFFMQGQQYELERQLDENSHHAEALPPVILPAHPPHGE